MVKYILSMRKETVNTFTEGMISDLNPLNMPNNALTDCVNGTILTYDGNEYSLQTDMGNVKLSNCELEENYIPVGIKEYGDVLYIVSYNPFEDRVEIGSYPSTKTVITTGKDPDEKSYQTITQFIESSDESSFYYEKDIEVSDAAKEQLFLDRIEINKLNPGDKYNLSIKNFDNSDNFERTKFFISDDDNKKYNITDLIEFNKDTYCKWTIPGWLGGENKFAKIDQLTYKIKNTSSSYSKNQNFNVSFKLKASDGIFTKNKILGPSPIGELFVEVFKVCDSSTEIPCGKIKVTSCVSYPNDDIYFITDELKGLVWNEDTVKKYIFIPSLIISDNNKKIYYDNCKITTLVSTKASASSDGITLGDSTWNYNITINPNDNKEVLFLTFDTNGISPINSEVFSLDYNIYKFGNTEPIKQIENDSNWNASGESVLKIEDLPMEDLYEIEFFIKSDGVVEKRIDKKLIFASVLMNQFDDLRFDNLHFDTILKKYTNYLNNKDFEIVFTNTEAETNCRNIGSEALDAFKKEGSSVKADNSEIYYYDTAIVENKLIDESYIWNVDKTIDANLSKFPKLLNGPFWDDFNSRCCFKYDLDGTGYKEKNYTRKGEIEEDSTRIIGAKLSTDIKCPISFNKSAERVLWNYSHEKINSHESGLSYMPKQSVAEAERWNFEHKVSMVNPETGCYWFEGKFPIYSNGQRSVKSAIWEPDPENAVELYKANIVAARQNGDNESIKVLANKYEFPPNGQTWDESSTEVAKENTTSSYIVIHKNGKLYWVQLLNTGGEQSENKTIVNDAYDTLTTFIKKYICNTKIGEKNGRFVTAKLGDLNISNSFKWKVDCSAKLQFSEVCFYNDYDFFDRHDLESLYDEHKYEMFKTTDDVYLESIQLNNISKIKNLPLDSRIIENISEEWENIKHTVSSINDNISRSQNQYDQDPYYVNINNYSENPIYERETIPTLAEDNAGINKAREKINTIVSILNGENISTTSLGIYLKDEKRQTGEDIVSHVAIIIGRYLPS